MDTIKLVQEEKLDLGIIGTTSTQDDLNFIRLCKIQDILVASGTYLEKLNLNSADDTLAEGSFMLLENPNATREHIEAILINIISISFQILKPAIWIF
ncbi:DNA-binding transcriptional LysR family regulator [Clostridium beijerinckii]|nr:DNA-binding transcriptional LysR family regulator [Clostridium beijerinckii]